MKKKISKRMTAKTEFKLTEKTLEKLKEGPKSLRYTMVEYLNKMLRKRFKNL